jgi:hypothetical protein
MSDTELQVMIAKMRAYQLAARQRAHAKGIPEDEAELIKEGEEQAAAPKPDETETPAVAAADSQALSIASSVGTFAPKNSLSPAAFGTSSSGGFAA